MLPVYPANLSTQRHLDSQPPYTSVWSPHPDGLSPVGLAAFAGPPDSGSRLLLFVSGFGFSEVNRVRGLWGPFRLSPFFFLLHLPSLRS
jgi:hypothetical protein